MEGHGLRQSDNKDFPELGYRMQTEVCPLHGDRKLWQDFASWRANECISIPTFRCFECGTHNLDTATAVAPVQSRTVICRHRWPPIATGTSLPDGSAFKPCQFAAPRRHQPQPQPTGTCRIQRRGIGQRAGNESAQEGSERGDRLGGHADGEPLHGIQSCPIWRLNQLHGNGSQDCQHEDRQPGAHTDDDRSTASSVRRSQTTPSASTRRGCMWRLWIRFYTIAETAIMALAVCRWGASPFRILGILCSC